MLVKTKGTPCKTMDELKVIQNHSKAADLPPTRMETRLHIQRALYATPQMTYGLSSDQYVDQLLYGYKEIDDQLMPKEAFILFLGSSD